MFLDHDTDAAIERAKARARGRNIPAKQRTVTAAKHDRTVTYTCGSYTHDGCHRVTLHYTADGVTATCDCEAGQSGRICHHVAAALMAEEMPQVEPAPEPTGTLEDEIRALAGRLRRYWTTEVGSWAEHDALLAQLRELRSRAKSAPAPWKDPNFINSLMNPGAF